MTSLLPDTARAEADLRHRRPLLVVATLGGAAAALGTLVVCLGVAVVGWFLTDAGAHGTPSDALRVGTLGWLLGHGSGLTVEGARLTVMPLGVTLACAWTVWRLGARVGDSVSGHGPDADGLADGQRDWTVPTATLLFTLGYAAVAAVALRLAATPATAPGGGRVMGWSVLLCLAFGGTAIAVGSGRAAIWAAVLPPTLRGAAETCRRILRAWLLVCGVALVAALVADLGTAVNVMAQLHTDAGEATLYLALTALLLPNALAFTGSYLAGPGFTVGAQTLVSPSAVSIGALPMFPLLAALPDNGPTSAWTAWLVALPPLVAAVATARALRSLVEPRWDEALLRGLVGGVAAGLAFGLVAGIAGGAVGPGRMSEVGPLALDATVHAVAAFGLGGLAGGAAAIGWRRRALRRTRAAAKGA